MNKTTIAISLETKERLDKLGNKGHSYDAIIKYLLDDWENPVIARKATKGFFARLLQKRIWTK